MAGMVVNGNSVVWFFLGSVLGLIAAIWDFCDAMMNNGTDAAGTAGEADDAETVMAMERSLITDNDGWWSWFDAAWSTTYLYQSLVLLAPLCYLVEAVVEISSKFKTTTTSHNRNRRRRNSSGDDDNTMIRILHRWNDLFFAVGAICELSGTMMWTLVENMTIAPMLANLLSTHAYCVNGIVALWQQDHHRQCCIDRRHTSSSNNNNDDALLYSGDILFGAGATLDLILSYIACFSSSLDRRKSGNIMTSSVNLISAICWCANAVLYLIVWERQRRIRSSRRRRQRRRRFDPNHNDDNNDALLVVVDDDDAAMDDHDNENDNNHDNDNNDMVENNNDLETPLLLHHDPSSSLQPPPQHDSTPTPPPSAVVVDDDDFHHGHHNQGGDHYSSSSQTTTESGGSIMRNRRAAAAAVKTTTTAPLLHGTGVDPSGGGDGGAWHNNNNSPPRWIRERPHLV
jgi:hypothetical protein